MLAFLTGHGYLFLTDMVCGPMNWCAAPLLQRAVLLSILPFAFGSMLLLARRRSFPTRWALASAALYALNPYVYERMLAGQWRVAMGYAVFPGLLALLIEGWMRRDIRLLALFSTAFGLTAQLSPHWAFIGGGFFLLVGLVSLSIRGFPTPTDGMRREWQRWELMLMAMLVPFFLVCGLGSWAVGDGPGALIRDVTEDDFRAFATVADPHWGTWMNVANLYGFWQQDMLLPKDFFGAWFLVGPVLLVFALVGLFTRARRGSSLAIATLVALPVAFIISVGYGSGMTRDVVRFLAEHLPGFAGLRETHKVAGLIAFTYALYAPKGLRFVLAHWRIGRTGERVVAGVLVVLALVSSNGLLGDFHGQVHAVSYPASWQEASDKLASDGARGILVLPWSGYLPLAWSQGRTLANPARAFFPFIVSSARTSNRTYRIASETTELDDPVFRLVQGLSTLEDEAPDLHDAGITHVVLMKAADWKRYTALLTNSSCVPLYDGPEIRVCRLR